MYMHFFFSQNQHIRVQGVDPSCPSSHVLSNTVPTSEHGDWLFHLYAGRKEDVAIGASFVPKWEAEFFSIEYI